ncbi:hypothetical protein EBBID32_36320 [Sphingobium indicum BiD32]|uniref:Uncharacterized protein n=1 Tax=Sphingobium indicum BiD32 TaxID=1301087 RepID=N1MQR4_9SPHN|nr:hypothetical protein EBBID32_36320 [Sphingobium indicum BiD32]
MSDKYLEPVATPVQAQAAPVQQPTGALHAVLWSMPRIIMSCVIR